MVGKLSDRHIPELDGLRAIAAIAILLFHAHIPLFADAWVGVPIFFVLSGFLVTGILLDSLEAKNFYSAFYIRRGLRIFPIYYLLLLVIAIPYALFIQPDREFALYALYLQNIQLGITNFSGTFAQGILNHTWSLAIETQFYLIWPFLVKIFRLEGILILCPLLVILSIGLRLILMVLDLRTLSWALLPTCLDTLCIGAFLAALIRTDLIHKYQSYLRLAALSLVVLIISGYWLLVKLLSLTPVWAPGQLHPSTFSGSLFLSLLGPLIGIIALIIISGWAPFLKFFLCLPPLLYIAKISYGLYLYHYPIYEIVNYLNGSFLDVPSQSKVLIQIILTVCVSVLSWHFIEYPVNLLKRRFPYQHRQESFLVSQANISKD